MKEESNYYAIIPANVRYDKNLSPSAKLMYGEITALSNKNGYCYASNEYLANMYDVSKSAVSKMITQLAEQNYIRIVINYKNGTKQVESRHIYINQTQERKHTKRKLQNETIIQNNVEHKQEVDVYKSNKQTEEVNVMQMFNMKFETNYKSIPGNLTNLCIEYKIEDFAKVINNAFEDQFWKDKATPSSIFKVDNFERLLNQKPKQKEITIADLDIDYSDF